jgi:hypothetical protein
LSAASAFGFALKAGDPVGIEREFLRQNLDRDFSFEVCVLRAVHLTHAALAEQGYDFIRRKLLANLHGHVLSIFYAEGMHLAMFDCRESPEQRTKNLETHSALVQHPLPYFLCCCSKGLLFIGGASAFSYRLSTAIGRKPLFGWFSSFLNRLTWAH